MNIYKLSKDESSHEDLRLFDYRIRFITRIKMTETRTNENRHEKRNIKHNRYRWKKKNDLIEINVNEDAETNIHSKIEEWLRRERNLTNNNKWRNRWEEVKRKALTNEAIRQRRYESSADMKRTHSATKISQFQQSQIITKRRERARIMNLTEKRNIESKIFNYIMSILEKSNTIKQNFESYRFRKIAEFSIKKQFQRRALSEKSQDIVNKWFNVSDIIIESVAKTSEQQAKVRRLFYTWRDCFVMKMIDIKITNLIEHFIVLKSRFKFVKEKIFRYISKKREFANQIFSQMKEADIITRMNNDWDARIKFS